MRKSRVVDVAAVLVLFVALASGIQIASAALAPAGLDISADAQCQPIVPDCPCGKVKDAQGKCTANGKNMNGCNCKSSKVPVGGKCASPKSGAKAAGGTAISGNCVGQAPSTKPPGSETANGGEKPTVTPATPTTGSTNNPIPGSQNQQVACDFGNCAGVTEKPGESSASLKPGQTSQGTPVQTNQGSVNLPAEAANANAQGSQVPVSPGQVVSAPQTQPVSSPGQVNSAPSTAPTPISNSQGTAGPGSQAPISPGSIQSNPSGLQPQPAGSISSPVRPQAPGTVTSAPTSFPTSRPTSPSAPSLPRAAAPTFPSPAASAPRNPANNFSAPRNPISNAGRFGLSVISTILSFIPSPSYSVTVAPPPPTPLPQKLPPQTVIYTDVTSCPPGKPCQNIPVAFGPPTPTKPANGISPNSPVPLSQTQPQTSPTTNQQSGSYICTINSFSFLQITGGNNQNCSLIGTAPSPLPTPNVTQLTQNIGSFNGAHITPVVTVTASPKTVRRSSNTTISWTSAGTTACSLYQGNNRMTVGDSNGSYKVSILNQTTTFAVWCLTADSGQIQGETTVFVN